MCEGCYFLFGRVPKGSLREGEIKEGGVNVPTPSEEPTNLFQPKPRKGELQFAPTSFSGRDEACPAGAINDAGGESPYTGQVSRLSTSGFKPEAGLRILNLAAS